MRITREHRDAESRFRELLDAAVLPEPDDVEYEPESVIFYWHEPRVAIFVDLDGADSVDSLEAAGTADPESEGSVGRRRRP
jgi:hypothetical protein